MIIEILFIGLVAGFLFYEATDLSPGGVVAPGYLALFIHQPQKIAVTLVLALVVWAVVKYLSSHLLLYGRRRLLVALLIGFACKAAIELWIRPGMPFQLDIESIGYLIPGLIGAEMSRQKPVQTVAALVVVTAVVYLVTLIVFPVRA